MCSGPVSQSEWSGFVPKDRWSYPLSPVGTIHGPLQAVNAPWFKWKESGGMNLLAVTEVHLVSLKRTSSCLSSIWSNTILEIRWTCRTFSTPFQSIRCVCALMILARDWGSATLTYRRTGVSEWNFDLPAYARHIGGQACSCQLVMKIPRRRLNRISYITAVHSN